MNTQYFKFPREHGYYKVLNGSSFVRVMVGHFFATITYTENTMETVTLLAKTNLLRSTEKEFMIAYKKATEKLKNAGLS